MLFRSTPIGTHFAPHNSSYVDLTGQSAYDPEKAKALLAEAGLPDGFTTTLNLPPPSYARRGGEIIPAQLPAECAGISASDLAVEMKAQANRGMADNSACAVSDADLDNMASMMMKLPVANVAA